MCLSDNFIIEWLLNRKKKGSSESINSRFPRNNRFDRTEYSPTRNIPTQQCRRNDLQGGCYLSQVTWIYYRFATLKTKKEVACFQALLLLWMVHPNDEISLIVVMLVLLAIGTSGGQISKDLLYDKENKTRSITRVLAFLLAISLSFKSDVFGGFDSSWKSSFFICLIPRTLAVIIFGFDHVSTKRHVIYKSPKNLDVEKGENEGIKREIAPHLDGVSAVQEKRNIPYKVVLKSLLKLLPIWIVFSLPSTISAVGSTIYLQQYRNRDNDDSKLDDVVKLVHMYTLVRTLAKFGAPVLYRWKNEKVKTCIGMLSGVGSCFCAWQLEVHRLEVSNLVFMILLLPQFLFLGFMEGLTREGLRKFYKSIIKKEQLQGYQEQVIEFVMGTGKFLNIVLIYKLKGWFGHDINDSRLDKYYLVFVFAGLVNLIIYCFIAFLFYKDLELANDDLQQDHFREQIIEIVQTQGLANDDQRQDNEDFTNVDVDRDLCIEQFNDIEQNQDLAKEDQTQDNEDLTNRDVQQDHRIEQSSGIDQNQELADEGHKQDDD
ncbi:hypothetical protein L1987_12961 [Smallanthus sonchifolius]|uniref:Uncharacterized protein n=1 Tax=Smallanthus sonchifolius TaxID=185202 RepID=A0ACB9JG65_9ASTR|nr:hypothetical protein L1987_12961 [Smallanthus sonchifolius]